MCGLFDTNILELHSSHAGSKINRSVKLPSNKKNGYKFKYSTVCNKQERVSFVCFSYFVASSFTTTRRFFLLHDTFSYLTLSLTAFFLHDSSLPLVSFNLVVQVTYDLGSDKSPPPFLRAIKVTVLLSNLLS